MNFRERVTVDIADVLNESEESDQEYMSFSSRLLVEDIDIANFYKNLCSDNRFNNNPNRKHQKSVTVQTDPDISNIPPSWLIEREQLVDELYTGLGNIINSIYYNPQSYNKKDAMKRANLNPSGMKYFTFENGYWQSTLLPSVKIPGLIETDRQNRSLCSEDTKRKLFHLLEVATKLRNVIPDVSHLASCENQIAGNGMQPYLNSNLNVEPSVELGRSQAQGEDVKISDHNIQNIDLVDDLVGNGRVSEMSSVCSQENCDFRNPLTKRLRKDSVHEVMKKKQVVMDDGYGSEEIPGVKVLKYAVASRVCINNQNSKVVHKLLKEEVNTKNWERNFSSGKTTYAAAHPDSKVLPSCSNTKLTNKIHQCSGARDASSLPKREKRALYDQENCNKSKSNRGNPEKDFIRKNILDLKNKHNPSISVTVRNSHIINTEPRGTTQNGRRTSPPPREEMYHRFLR